MKSDPQESLISNEEILDKYIDELNQGHTPKKSTNAEASELEAIAKIINSQSPQAEPSEDFITGLWHKLKQFDMEQDTDMTKSPDHTDKTQGNQYHLNQISSYTRTRSKPSKKKFIPWAGLVASLLVFLLLFSPWAGPEQNIVLAMEKSVNKLENYHGVLEKISTNAAGESQVLTRTEIWSDGEKYATKTKDGILTVNNGDIRWSTNPIAKEITLLSIYLDPHDFDLRKEATKALRYPHQIIGEETVAGRAATHLEIQPPGGLPYSLWIDQETHLPIQLQTAMQKSLQTTYTYVNLEPNTTIPQEFFAYNPPQDYKIIDKNPDSLVAGLDEALKVSGISPLQPTEAPKRFFASPNRIVFDFGDTVVIQEKATSSFILDPLAQLGQANDGPLEILPESLRWQQDGLEILVRGERLEGLAKQITSTINLTPQSGQTPSEGLIINVPTDLEVVKNNQQQVDAGSSPWQLDPYQVAFTFVALQISPEGITGEPPLDFNALELTANDGKKAVVQVTEGPAKAVYLERLIRQDETGIWTVTGYVPR